MRIIDKCILLGITLVSLAACTNPESLIEKDRKSEEEKILETFSDKRNHQASRLGYPIERGRTIQ